jgi:uncharacterized repeat protein (TIGR03803 family)
MKGISAALIACVVGCVMHGPATEAQTESVLYSFCSQLNCSDGKFPAAGLIGVNGTLYGTTLEGGTPGCTAGSSCGTVFSLNPETGAETVLHSFQNNGTDGWYPEAALIDVDGTLYGTTEEGGTYSRGTVFSVDLKTGAETVLHSFKKNGRDGTFPFAALINVNGTLYGTTYSGGTGICADGCGTVFSLKPKTGAETVYSFGNVSDGASPSAGLINVKGTLFGATVFGGAYSIGTVFSLNPKTSAETVLHSFGSGTDGALPYAGLIDVGGTLYGTTEYGGTGGLFGYGTVFSLNLKTGTETVLFQYDGADGESPVADVISVTGTLYGTTLRGSTHDSGTVFSLDPKTGAQTVLYSFCSQQNCADGEYPDAGLINVEGTLYGTTESGGAYGGGTVFSIVP